VPKSYQDALTFLDKDLWLEAHQKEMDSLEECAVFDIIKRPPNANVLANFLIWTIKQNPDGTKKYKVRSVANGKLQYPDQFGDTYAPTLDRRMTIRLIFHLVVNKRMFTEFADVCTAFLYADLVEDNVYMTIPDGYRTDLNRRDYVAKLNKALYGLKQAGHEWNKLIDRKLQEMGLQRSVLSPCLYHASNESMLSLVAIHVDDAVIASTSSAELIKIKRMLSINFKMKFAGSLPAVFLGLNLRGTYDDMGS
jgi:hypothetical protein